MNKTTKITTLAAFALSCGLAAPAHAQFGRILKAHVKQKVTQKAVDHAENAADKTIDKADAAVTCVITDSQCMQKAQAAGTAVTVTDANGRPVSTRDSAKAMAAAGAAQPAAGQPATRPGEGAWANYDFIPGDRPIFVDDFSDDNVGDFPRRLEFRSGNMDIVEWQGERWLRGGGSDQFVINLPETLPERFTMEFDLAGSGNAMEINFVSEKPDAQPRLAIDADRAWLLADPVRGEGDLQANTAKTPVKIRISVDGTYLKLYANEHRALNVPNAKLGRSKHIFIYMNGWSADAPRMIGNIRIAAGGRKLYDALATSGRVATHGILFATGSATIEGESTPTLKEIGEMLRAHPDLKLTIEGHTDNVGSAAANQALSEQRAAAVAQYLMTHYGIDSARLVTKGFGASKPVASNDTPEGRQQNRRVELVKM